MSQYWPGLVLLAIAAAIFLSSRKKKAKALGLGKPWRVLWSSKDLPANPAIVGQGCEVRMAAGMGTHLHYLLDFDFKAPAVNQELTLVLEVIGGPFHPMESPGAQGTASLMLQRKKDPGNQPGYRYFSKQQIPLVPGIHTLKVRVNIQEMGDILSDTNGPALGKVLQEFAAAGVIFGGDDGRGHGAFSETPAIIRVLSLT